MDLGKLEWTKLRGIALLAEDVLPVAVQDVATGDVLMVAYASREAVTASVERAEAVFWSTSKNEVHHKGSTSGDTLELVEVRVNCERNSLLYRVRRKGVGACHVADDKGRFRLSCFFRSLADVCG